MSRWMDGGGGADDDPTNPLQFWPQHYGDRYYTELPTFINLCADEGLRVEFTVFADAGYIMPEHNKQRVHLDRVLDQLRPVAVSVFVEIENEYSINKHTNLEDLVHSNWGSLWWATGDYDMERIDVVQPDGSFKSDPRPEMLKGRYVTFHGKRGLDGSLIESAKEGYFYGRGWNTINHEGNRSRAEGCNRPCVHDEPMGCGPHPFNQWGDERYIDPEHARIMAAGHRLSTAGTTFHSEAGCVSGELSDIELACAKAYMEGLSTIRAEAPNWPYEHDRTPGHTIEDVPHLGGDDWAAGESVSRTKGSESYAVTVLLKGDYKPVIKPGWPTVVRIGSTERGQINQLMR